MVCSKTVKHPKFKVAAAKTEDADADADGRAWLAWLCLS